MQIMKNGKSHLNSFSENFLYKMKNKKYLFIFIFFINFNIYAAEQLVGFSEEELEPDEAGLWMVVEKQEQEIRTSSIYIDDPELNLHVKNILCNIVGESCSYLRPYIIRAPGFNAFMMPNGAFFIQTGLLLRVSDDNQLASVIGHEASHYYRNHSIQQIRKVYKTSNTFAVIGAIVSAASTVSINSATSYDSYANSVNMSNSAIAMLQAAQIVAVLQLLDYSREMESEADIDSVTWMSKAAFDLSASVALWDEVIKEQEAGGNEAGFSILSTHPAPAQRIIDLNSQIASFQLNETQNQPIIEIEITKLVDKYRDDWLVDEMRILHPDQFKYVLERQVERGYPQHDAAYLEGMSYLDFAENENSKRKKKEYYNQSISALENAIKYGGINVKPESYRELGKIHEVLENDEEAKKAYRNYLEFAPDAWDARFIRRKL
jgi:beta-barrel assembly-enhancing protease